MLGNNESSGKVGHGGKEVEWGAELAVRWVTGAQHHWGSEKPRGMPSRMVPLPWFILPRRMGSWDIYLPSPRPCGLQVTCGSLGLCFQSGCGFRDSPEALELWNSLEAPEVGYWKCAFVVQSLHPIWLQPHGLRNARLHCPSLSPGACSNSFPLSQWYHPTISSPVVPFSSCLQSFPASGSFLVSRLFTLGGQSNGTSASASVLPMNIQDWFPLGWTGLISLKSKGLSSVFSNTVQNHQFFGTQFSSQGEQ